MTTMASKRLPRPLLLHLEKLCCVSSRCHLTTKESPAGTNRRSCARKATAPAAESPWEYTTSLMSYLGQPFTNRLATHNIDYTLRDA